MSPLKHLQLATQSHQAPENLYFKLLKWRTETVATGTGTVQNGAELGAPGDEYNKSPCREGRARLLEDKTHRPLRSREYGQIPFFPSRCLHTAACLVSADFSTAVTEISYII